MFLLAGDKGYGREDELLEWGEPSLAVHGGCFSLAVNFHALGEWTRNQGGTVLGTPHRSVGLDIWGFVLGLPPGQTDDLRAAFTAAIVEEGPDDLYALLAGIEPHYDTLAVPQVLALLRLSRGDHRILLSCFEVLLQAAGTAPPSLKEELSAAIREVWAAYFHIGEERDLPFHLASLLFEMGYSDEALALLHRSVQLYGPNAGTSHNIALCHYRRRELDEALRHMDEALAMDPTFESARKMRLRIRAERGRRQRP
jgi:tetratricopeptide (TPR) repeat protein